MNYDHKTGKPSQLPLEIFDDTEFESRSPAEWIQLGTDSSGACSIEAKALKMDKEDGVRFRPAEVLSYDANDAKFVVKYKDTGVAVKVYRIHLCFQVCAWL